MSYISIHGSYLWMFEVLEAKIIVFAKNKQADKKYLLEEFFNSVTTEQNLSFQKKSVLWFVIVFHLLRIFRNLPRRLKNNTDDL